MRMTRVAGLLALLAGGPTLAGAVAQEPPAGTRATAPRTTSPLLPAGHWALDALWKAESLGLLRGYLPASGDLPSDEAGALLLEAIAGAETRAPELVPLARGWYARFTEEFAGPGASADRARLIGAAASLGYAHDTGRAAPGLGQYPPDRTGPLSLPDRSDPVGALALSAALGTHLAAEAAPELDPYGVRLRSVEATAGWGKWEAGAGRRPESYGIGRADGLVLSAGEPFDRIRLSTRAPMEPGGWLRPLGLVSFHTFLSLLPEDRHPGRPFFWGARGSIKPHPRVVLAVQRGVMFGGDRADVRVTARSLLRLLIGGVGGGAFEDQIASVSGSYRLPSEPVLPLTLYAEWGTEDAAGAWWDVPGRLVGVYAPSLPSLPEVELGMEFARLAGSCCSNPPWYRHTSFPGSWSGRELPLGHPLGGEGSELRLYSRGEVAQGRLRLGAEGFRRDRGGENLYAPERGGQEPRGRADLALAGRPVAGAGRDVRTGGGEGVGGEPIPRRRIFLPR